VFTPTVTSAPHHFPKQHARPGRYPSAVATGRVLAALLSLLTALLSLPARADNPVDRDNERLAASAAREGKRAAGALSLLRIWARWDDSDPRATTALLEKLAADTRLSPARRVDARRLLARARARLGQMDALSKTYDELGYVTRFRVIGPFDNEGKGGFDTETPPESKRMEAPDPHASYPGRERAVSWRSYPEAVAQNGYVSFGAVMRPLQNVCALAETFVHSERAQALSLFVGGGGATKVYWNGEEVFRDPAYRAPYPDRSAATVGAHKGDNRLLVKVCVTDSTWGFYLRLGDSRGGVAQGLSIKTESEKALDIPRGHAKVRLGKAPQTPLAELEAAVAKGGAGKKPRPQDQHALARYLQYTGSDDPAERRAKQLAAAAADAMPSIEHLRLAHALAEERGEVMRFADKAAEVAPEAPASLLLRARVLADGPVPEDALPLIDRIPEDSDSWHTGQLLRAGVLRELEMPESALAVVESVQKRIGETPRLFRLLANLYHAVGKTDQSLELHRKLLTLRSDDMAARRVLITDALHRGDTATVQAAISELSDHGVDSTATLRYVASLYDALGRDDMVLSTYRRAMDIVPESAPLHVAYGHALLRAGQPEHAADALAKALALRPQDASTRELLEQIRPRERLDEAYALPTEKLLKLRGKGSGYPSTTLTELQVNTVYENGLSTSFRQFAAQVHDDEGARRYRSYSIQYDPDTQRVDLRLARVYRKDGRQLESVRTYEQQLGEPWYRIYYDTRAVVVIFPDLEPEDVVEIRYRIDDVAHRNVFADYYGDIHYFQGFSPTLRSEYVLVTPKTRKFYFNKPKLEGLSHTQKVEGDVRIDHFLAKDVEAIVSEAGMPGLTEMSPYLHVSTYKTWQDVGTWYWGLIKDQLYADSSLKEKVAELTKGAKTTQEKVAAIHNWVVGHTRYVGLEFGIHGFLPYRVPLIVQRGFGDCKDKASLLYTMFQSAGIDARIVLVRTRRNGAVHAEPASLAVFDHAIAYVPELDLFLDGTAEHSGTSELPVQDQGVSVLVVGPGGAELRKTPVFAAEHSRRSRTLEVALSVDGSAKLRGREEVRGAEAAGYRSYYEAPGTRDERFERALGRVYPGVELAQQKFEQLGDLEQSVRYSYEARVPQLAQRDGDSLQLSPSVMSDLVQSMARLPKRRHALDLQGNRAYVEERIVTLPQGMVATELPKGGEARSVFGRLKLDVRGEGRTVRATTEFSVDRDRVGPEEYPAFRRWVEQADLLLRQRIGIRKDEQ